MRRAGGLSGEAFTARSGTDDGDGDHDAAALGAVLPNVCQRESKCARAYAVHRMHVEGADALIFISLPG
jgi:hypothetical protein